MREKQGGTRGMETNERTCTLASITEAVSDSSGQVHKAESVETRGWSD